MRLLLKINKFSPRSGLINFRKKAELVRLAEVVNKKKDMRVYPIDKSKMKEVYLKLS